MYYLLIIQGRLLSFANFGSVRAPFVPHTAFFKVPFQVVIFCTLSLIVLGRSLLNRKIEYSVWIVRIIPILYESMDCEYCTHNQNHTY